MSKKSSPESLQGLLDNEEHNVRGNDEKLDDLYKGASIMKHKTEDIGNDLENHNKITQEINDHLDNMDSKINKENEKMRKLTESIDHNEQLPARAKSNRCTEFIYGAWSNKDKRYVALGCIILTIFALILFVWAFYF